jgi:hypothetical protein
MNVIVAHLTCITSPRNLIASVPAAEFTLLENRAFTATKIRERLILGTKQCGLK